MPELIFHHYPQSPVSEKVRIVIGLKKLSWRSVEIPRIPPKPDLIPLTGGYRRTPVMQLGADIYCDSQCIIREIERRFPVPTLYPGGGDGLAWGMFRWVDEEVFPHAIRVVLGAQIDSIDPTFLEDRARLYFGSGWSREKIADAVPYSLAQLRALFGWMEQRLARGRRFMLGENPGLPDAVCYHVIWFLRGRFAGGPAFLSQFQNLLQWEQRIYDLGHGTSTDLSSEQALDLAMGSTSISVSKTDPDDPEKLEAGQLVSITPEGDGGDPEVVGELVFAGIEELAVKLENNRVGEIVVHFPRVGYKARRL